MIKDGGKERKKHDNCYDGGWMIMENILIKRNKVKYIYIENMKTIKNKRRIKGKNGQKK